MSWSINKLKLPVVSIVTKKTETVDCSTIPRHAKLLKLRLLSSPTSFVVHKEKSFLSCKISGFTVVFVCM